jgi:hypothetical protein
MIDRFLKCFFSLLLLLILVLLIVKCFRQSNPLSISWSALSEILLAGPSPSHNFMVSLCSHPNSGPLFETYPDCGTLIERKENLGWALGLREAKQSAAHLSRVVISFGDSECQVDVAVNSVSSVCPLSVFSVDCSTVECPPVQQAVCPLDSYETQVRLTADGCCTLPARLVRHPFKFPFCLSWLAPSQV